MLRCIYLIFISLFFISTSAQSIENYIVLKVNNNIITNIDIENEYRYLIALNKNLEKLEKNKLYSLAKESIIREKIKKDEIEKFIITDNLDNEYSEKIFKNFYQNLGIKSEEGFKAYLKKYNLSYEDVKKKILIEISWNNFIYEKFLNEININEDLIRKKISKENENIKESITLYSLSEILFQVENSNDYEKKLTEIRKNIEKIGFEASANIFSVSSTSKLGGKLGWVESDKISKNIKKNIDKLNKGDYTNPITIPGGFLIIKLNDTKVEKKLKKYNLEDEIKKAIQFEKNKQLDKFSKLYFSRLKKDSYISE